MNRDDIICLAAEAGFSRHQFGGMFDVYLERFAVLITKEEREKCALECESRHENGNRKYSHPDECAAAIRTRKDDE